MRAAIFVSYSPTISYDGSYGGARQHIVMSRELPEGKASPTQVHQSVWLEVAGDCASLRSSVETLSSHHLSTRTVSSLLTSTVSLALPPTQYTAIWITTFVLTNTAVRLKTRRASLHSGNFAPRSCLLDSLIFGLLLLLCGPVRFAGYSTRLKGEFKAREGQFAALAKEESQARLLFRASNRFFAVRSSRRSHTHLCWPCFTDDYIIPL